MIDSGSIQQCECERRLINLHSESHRWLLNSANKVTRNKEESEDLVQELYIYLHEKCNPKLFWGKDSYNLFYASKFLHSRFINKTKKLNRISLVDEVWSNEIEIPYDIEYDERLQNAHDEVLNTIRQLKNTKQFASAMIWEMYYMSDDTLDEVANKIGISKSTTFLAVRKVRRILKEVIENPFN